jgi:dTDP-4-dehydrorhamnose 3,5-epimerase
MMQILETELAGLLILEPKVFADSRGNFLEAFQKERFRAAGLPPEFVQDNFSRSAFGTIRGLHYQLAHPQGKLVQVTRGTVFDLAVDLRKSSPTFGRWHGVELSESNHRQLFIPPGFAHGFCVVSREGADFFYKCTDYYRPDDERTLLFSDPAIGIRWPDVGTPIVSPKDERGLPLAAADVYP